MKKNEIKFEGNWYNVGDYIKVKEQIGFLWFYLPIYLKRKYKIYFIGEDAGAAIVRKDIWGNTIETQIVGDVNIYR